jgi:hypothetical protein
LRNVGCTDIEEKKDKEGKTKQKKKKYLKMGGVGLKINGWSTETMLLLYQPIQIVYSVYFLIPHYLMILNANVRNAFFEVLLLVYCLLCPLLVM